MYNYTESSAGLTPSITDDNFLLQNFFNETIMDNVTTNANTTNNSIGNNNTIDDASIASIVYENTRIFTTFSAFTSATGMVESNNTDIDYNGSNSTATVIAGNFLDYCEPVLTAVFNDSFTDDSMEEEDDDVLFHFVSYGILLNTIGVFGIFGNIVSMIILSRPQMKSSINYLLIGLARCDTVLIITSMLLFGLPSVYTATGYLFVYYFRIYPLVAPIIYPIGMISQTVSVYLTLTVTLERFVAVCRPLQARSLCTCGRARFYVVLIIIFSVLYNITRFWEVTVRECIHNKYNVLIYRVHPSNLRNNHLYISVYIHWMYLIFMYFIPFSFLAILNTAIYRQVRRANQERQRLSRLQKKEIGLATMLLCVVVVFLICNAMALVSNVLEAFYGKTIDCLVESGNLMVTINSSVNFVIYVIFGEKFKRLFFKLFFPHGFNICGTAFRGGRDSPEQTHEDSFISYNGEFRGAASTCITSAGTINSSVGSGRHMHRVSTSVTRNNGRSSSCQQQHHSAKKSSYNSRLPRASSPGPCVHYPHRDSRGFWDQTSSTNF